MEPKSWKQVQMAIPLASTEQLNLLLIGIADSFSKTRCSLGLVVNLHDIHACTLRCSTQENHTIAVQRCAFNIKGIMPCYKGWLPTNEPACAHVTNENWVWRKFMSVCTTTVCVALNLFLWSACCPCLLCSLLVPRANGDGGMVKMSLVRKWSFCTTSLSL